MATWKFFKIDNREATRVWPRFSSILLRSLKELAFEGFGVGVTINNMGRYMDVAPLGDELEVIGHGWT